MPNPQAGGSPLLVVHGCLFNIFAAALHCWRPSLHPQPKDAPCSDDMGIFQNVVHIDYVLNLYSRMYNSSLNYPTTYCNTISIPAMDISKDSNKIENMNV
jgi:hypothetical protein